VDLRTPAFIRDPAFFICDPVLVVVIEVLGYVVFIRSMLYLYVLCCIYTFYVVFIRSMLLDVRSSVESQVSA